MYAFIIILLGIEKGLAFCLFNFVDLPDPYCYGSDMAVFFAFIEQKSS